MKTSQIQSCCAGLQFKDFPNAHLEPPETNQATVIELLELMYQNSNSGFFYGFVNHRQNDQMGRIFTALGWTCVVKNNRIFLYWIDNPRLWLENQGLLPTHKIIPWEYKTANPYKTGNDIALKNWSDMAPKRQAFVDKLLKEFDVKLSDVPFVKLYEPLPPSKPVADKPKRVHHKKALATEEIVAVELARYVKLTKDNR